MRQSSRLRTYRIGFALLTFVAIVYQFVARAALGDFNPVNFFSFFTILSNIFAAVVLLLAGLRGDADGESSLTWDLVRGAAVAYMTTTFVVYGLLLTGYNDALQTSIPWVNNVLHRIFPLVLLIDWVVQPPRHPLTFRQALVWMVFPILYLVYSLLRGPLVGWYPYPFLDPRRAGGYPVVALYSLGIALGFFLFVALIVVIGRRVRLRIEPAG
ncbi:MAG TPA: Pr6Pr family membrane protein [Thermomicrobiales bacterium]|jgi:hypothetical protein